MTRLWTAADAAAATGGSTLTEWAATGVSIDTRNLAAGDLFIALRGPNHDGHDFVATALQRGAAAAMVDREMPEAPMPAPLLRVADTRAGLAALGTAGRNRGRARIVAVTGSVGKTGTKEALRLALASSGPTYASAGGLNNHWGAPLSLARLPPDARYGVFELGMNHPGEIAGLTRLAKPHIAVITTVEPVHLGFFPSIEAIADAKAEIFLGLEPGGVAVLNRDNLHYSRLAAAAKCAGAVEILGFGAHPESTARLVDCVLDSRGSTVEATVCGTAIRFLMPVPGRHWVMNALAALAAAQAAGAAVDHAAEALAELQALPAGGRRTTRSGARRHARARRRIRALAPRARRTGRRSRGRPPFSNRRGHRRARRGSSRGETRRVVAIARGSYACAAALSRTRRRRDHQGLPRRARQPRRGVVARAIRPA